MKKNFLFPVVFAVMLMGISSLAYAEDNTGVFRPDVVKPNVSETDKVNHNIDKFRGKHPHPQKAEMAAKKLEIEQRLNLTDEQKKQINLNREKDRAKMKPIMEKMRTNHEEMRKLKFDATLTQEEKEKKIQKLVKEKEALKQKANKYRQDNIKSFESVLTDEQKSEFEKIKSEQRQIMEQRRRDFEQNKKNIKHPMQLTPLKQTAVKN